MKPSKLLEKELLSDESIDILKHGKIKLIQSKTGYRFSIDAIFLSEFVTLKKGDVVVDLGTGCGVIPLLLLRDKPSIGCVFGLEIQRALASQASRNSIINNTSGKFGVLQGEIKNPPCLPSSVNVIVCNPPYRRKASGRINPDQQRAIARHEILASLDDILNASKYLLKTKGRLALIYPAERLSDLIIKMRNAGLEPKMVRVIYPDFESEAKLAMVEASLGGRPGLKLLPPLFGQG